ncbi:hypothetical protein ACPWR0_07245 [Pandoraea pneumonica]|uniref:hypothetical protein n=1 Tax=Pandoraea pneumonica TaxID=2508299 RepID=UPI003CF043E8
MIEIGSHGIDRRLNLKAQDRLKTEGYSDNRVFERWKRIFLSMPRSDERFGGGGGFCLIGICESERPMIEFRGRRDFARGCVFRRFLGPQSSRFARNLSNPQIRCFRTATFAAPLADPRGHVIALKLRSSGPLFSARAPLAQTSEHYSDKGKFRGLGVLFDSMSE